jgi:arsenate reductase (glutaredoxin)
VITIWHNSRCGKSRDSKNLLDEVGVEYEVFEYLKNEFTAQDIKDIMKKLGIFDVREMLRTKEKEYKDLNIKDESKTQDEIIDLVVQNPKLVERPIVIKGDKATIGRPIENVKALLG